MIRPGEYFYPLLIVAVAVIGVHAIVHATLRARRANRELAQRRTAGGAAR